MVLFVIGLVAVAVILVLFATGTTELPLWVNLLAMLAPVGFGLACSGCTPRQERLAGRARPAETPRRQRPKPRARP